MRKNGLTRQLKLVDLQRAVSNRRFTMFFTHLLCSPGSAVVRREKIKTKPQVEIRDGDHDYEMMALMTAMTIKTWERPSDF